MNINAMRLTLLLCTLAWFQPLGAQDVGIIEHNLYNVHGVSGITDGPDGALWFTTTPAIGRITRAGKPGFYAFPAGYQGGFSAITAGSDGALWFTNFSPGGIPAIGRVTTSGVFSEFSITTVPGFFLGITAGPDEAIWFTESNANKIGRITTAGALTEYVLPTANAYPYSITSGPDGALWFTEQSASAIGRITTAGVITEYPVMLNNLGSAMPSGITAGQDGALWFTVNNGYIGRVTTTGVFSSYFGEDGFQSGNGITVGADGALWFFAVNGLAGNEIGRLTTSGGLFSFYSIPSDGDLFDASFQSITKGLDAALWFSDGFNNEVGEAVSALASLSITPGTGTFGTAITLAGNGFGSGENVNLYAHSTSANLLATVAADATGSFSLATSIGPAPGIEHSVVGVGQSSHKIGVGHYGVTASLSCTPNQGTVGTNTKIEVLGLLPSSTVQLFFGTHFIASVETREAGAFVADYGIPAELAPGVYAVSVESDGLTLAQANFTID